MKSTGGEDRRRYKGAWKAGLLALTVATSAHAANFGRVVALAGGASDIVVDDSRKQLYLTQSVESQVQVYSVARSAFLTPISTGQTPLSAAMSRSGAVLYVVCYDASELDIINLNTLTLTSRVTLPAKPEGVAVAADERVLISTTGSGTAGTADLLLIYTPGASAPLGSVTVTPSAPAAPTFPPPSGRSFLSKHSQLVASRDGSRIAGVNAPATGSASVFVYEAISGTVTRARIVAGTSTAVSISDDGTRIASGSILFDASSLVVIGQQNAANIPYPFTPGGSFTTQANQGGSVFSPDGASLYSAFNIAPFQNPAVASTVGQLMINDPDNLMVKTGFFLPEGLAGRVVLSSDGANAYALSDSGFTVLPLSTIASSPVAVPSTTAALVTGDPCGVTAATATATVTVANQGKGAFTVNAQLLRYSNGGGSITIVGPGGIVITVPTGPGGTTSSNATTAPTVRTVTAGGNPALTFGFSSAFSTFRGTAAPPHDFLIQSPEAINIPNIVRVYENSRDSEARGTVLPIPVGPSAGTPLGDLTYDQTRQRVYIANSGLNRVDVYDIQSKALVTPIKVGQMPSSMAISPDGATLYVTSSNSETLSVVDLAKGTVIATVTFPPVPFNSNAALVIPSVIAASQNGVLLVTTDGTLWNVVGTSAVERPASRLIGATTAGVPNKVAVPTTMAATPAGDYVLMATNTGTAYLYSASADDFIAERAVLTTTQAGYLGPVAAGAGGSYFLMSGVLLNSALVPVNGTTSAGTNSAVAAISPTSYAVFTPVSSTSTTAPTVSLLDSRTGNLTGQVSALEGPLTQLAGGRLAVAGRTMAVDSAGTTAYAITTSGLSIIPLTQPSASAKPAISRGGVVNLASYTAAVAPNGLISIFGTALGSQAQPGSTPLPTTLGGTCITLNNTPIPLLLVSPTQINAQIPPSLAAGNYTLVIHSIANQTASASQTLAVSKYAPAVFVDSTGQLALYHADGTPVNVDYPATRDEPLVMYAAGLGATTGGAVTAGNPSPTSPLAVTAPVQVFFGLPTISQSPVIVDWSGLLPGYIGVYQLNLRIPGTHLNGDALPVTIRIGTANSPTTGPAVPYVAVH